MPTSNRPNVSRVARRHLKRGARGELDWAEDQIQEALDVIDDVQLELTRRGGGGYEAGESLADAYGEVQDLADALEHASILVSQKLRAALSRVNRR